MNKNYEDWSVKDIISELKKCSEENEDLKKVKKFGLVWEDVAEEGVEQCKKEFPLLEEDKNKAVINCPEKFSNYLIEGDNYHSLFLLQYTHKHMVDVIYIDPPYNTGAKNWKYNNDYVDKENAWRHSRWISMMEHRLSLAKNLLTKDGVLIVAIDENEVNELGLLLKQTFPSYNHHLVTIEHKPGGIQGDQFAYTHEYAYFVIPPNVKPAKRIQDPEWYPLCKSSGKDSERTSAKNCFYAIYVDPTTGKVVDFGNVEDPDYHPANDEEELDNGLIKVYPIRKGVERKWTYSREKVNGLKLRGRRLKTGRIEIEREMTEFPIKTMWYGAGQVISDIARKIQSRYNAAIHGTGRVKEVLGDREFDYPKSIYTVYDCIEPFVRDNKNAIILDFFAGSGTTGHVVMNINANDRGNRQFILCTNNENKIAEEITYEYLKRVIQREHEENHKQNDMLGYDDDLTFSLKNNLRYLKVHFQPIPILDSEKFEFVKHIEGLLNFKNNVLSEEITDNLKIFHCYRNNYIAIVLNENSIDECKDFIKNTVGNFDVYLFSYDEDVFEDDFAEFKDRVKLIPVPYDILDVYNKIIS